MASASGVPNSLLGGGSQVATACNAVVRRRRYDHRDVGSGGSNVDFFHRAAVLDKRIEGEVRRLVLKLIISLA